MSDSISPPADTGYDPYDSSSTRNQRIDVVESDFEAAARTADLDNDAQPYIGERATRDNIDQILAQGREYWQRVFKGAER